MSGSLSNNRVLAIAILLCAQLSISWHAAEHGVGQHVHDGVTCVFGLTDDDDTGLPPRPLGSLANARVELDCSIFSSAAHLDLSLRVPPATGPPVTA